MARTIYFPDGSCEVLLHEDVAADLERILRERLGDEVADLLLEVRCPEEGQDDYEFACDSYRRCLQDALDELQAALSVLETPRSDRRKVARSLNQVINSINNEL